LASALLTTSCTDALEMSAILLDIQPGDEVILPSYTFVSTANAFVLRGAKPVFCDVRPDTLNLDESKLEALITPRTKAIVPVHYAGVGCEMDAIIEIADRRGVAVIEDNAHGLFGKYKGRWLGTFGQMATQSFHETKNITCGEGGALLVNDSRFGLQAGVFTNNLQNAIRAFEELEVGGVMVNQVPTFRVENMPYGGIKESGSGREGVRYAMDEMTEPRIFVINKN
jgi:dTDP-4-amino-4,6-dideoxygalactose transaminase